MEFMAAGPVLLTLMQLAVYTLAANSAVDCQASATLLQAVPVQLVWNDQ